jgi:hypothetical protein
MRIAIAGGVYTSAQLQLAYCPESACFLGDMLFCACKTIEDSNFGAWREQYIEERFGY